MSNVPLVRRAVAPAPAPPTGASENENVPAALVLESAVIVMGPLRMPTPACQPAAGLPTLSDALAALSGPSE